jgi:hypothetical protein
MQVGLEQNYLIVLINLWILWMTLCGGRCETFCITWERICLVAWEEEKKRAVTMRDLDGGGFDQPLD